jgi:hypothetical protein
MFLQTAVGETAETVGNQTVETVQAFAGNPAILIGGIILIVAGILIILFLKRVIVNSIIGAIVWAIATFVFGINLPFIPSLVVSVIFGLPGIGVLLLLRFLSVI